MAGLGAAFIVSLCLMVGALAFSPAHSYRGYLASLNVIVLLASGLALAIHAL